MTATCISNTTVPTPKRLKKTILNPFKTSNSLVPVISKNIITLVCVAVVLLAMVYGGYEILNIFSATHDMVRELQGKNDEMSKTIQDNNEILKALQEKYNNFSRTMNDRIMQEYKTSMLSELTQTFVLGGKPESKAHLLDKHNLVSDTVIKDTLCTAIVDVESQNASALGWYHSLSNSSRDQSQVAPVIVDVDISNMDNVCSQSKSFFVFEDGHLMALSVYPNGHSIGEGTHVSVYLHHKKGPHDDELKQSAAGHGSLIRGAFTIELLNQRNDSNHYSHNFITFGVRFTLDHINGPAGDAEGWGKHQFISHQTLLQSNNYCHYDNTSLYFRISFNQIKDKVSWLH